jgi:hypothetical protein
MAIVQISRIQQRRGLQQDLPQLASAEFGWSLDQRRLFIGNGDVSEGAPTPGVTEILTEHTDLLNLVNTYTYKGLSGGYTVITGADTFHPVSRTLQDRLDDFAVVKNFGAMGDGITDDTDAIQRALYQLYMPVYNPSQPRVRRILFFPAGIYIISSTIYVPPYVIIVGEGKQSTILRTSDANVIIIKTSDSLMGNTISATNTLSRDVYLKDLRLQNIAANAAAAVMMVDSAFGTRCDGVGFETVTTEFLNNLVYITDNVSQTYDVEFDYCTFIGAQAGVMTVVTGNGIGALRVSNSYFDKISGDSVDPDNATNGVYTAGNFYGNVGNQVSRKANGNIVSIGETTTTGANSGVYLGRLYSSSSQLVGLVSGQNDITSVPVGAGEIQYQIDNGTDYRFGTLKYTNTGTTVSFDDSFTETTFSLAANLFINGNGGVVSCSVTNNATFKYSITQYV